MRKPLQFRLNRAAVEREARFGFVQLFALEIAVRPPEKGHGRAQKQGQNDRWKQAHAGSTAC